MLVVYMAHNIQVRELIRSVAVQVDFEKQGPCRGMIMSCRGMSNIKGTSQKPESSMLRHAHSMPRHEFGRMPRHGDYETFGKFVFLVSCTE